MRWLVGGGRHTVQQSVHRGSTNSRIMDSLNLPLGLRPNFIQGHIDTQMN
ncbi:unnamed protein product [Ectocarpus sp. 6 AP-2014]